MQSKFRLMAIALSFGALSTVSLSIRAELITQGSYYGNAAAIQDDFPDDFPNDFPEDGGHEPSVVLNNATIKAKYGASAILSNGTSATRYTPSTLVDNVPVASWLTHHPVIDARISSGWGTRSLLGSTRHHSGIDLAVPTGTPIYATGAGVVVKAGWGGGYGNHVDIDHGNGYLTRYGHASRLLVEIGQRVSAGQVIANVGCTGRCTGPHLHFEVVKAGQRQNPATYLALLP